MEQEEKKSPVEIVQKLIAIHTARKEASEKMVKNNASGNLQDKLSSSSAQSDRYINALLNELSQFGDAVQSEVNRDDDYNKLWNSVTVNIDTMDADSISGIFRQLENSLIKIYEQIIEAYKELPVTLNDLIVSQLKELKQTV
jgi:seryl-tRNA synthetase